MEVRYALYTKPFNSDIRKNNTHWCDKSVEFYMMAYSAFKMQSFGFETVLHTDKYGDELLKSLGITIDRVVVDLDNCEIKRRWWASGKVHAYTRGVGEFRPFIMCDNDAGFHTKPPEHLVNSRYACQSLHIDNNTEFEKQLLRVCDETPNRFPFDIFHQFIGYADDLKGSNSGIVIMNDKELWQEFTRYAWALFNHEWFDDIMKGAKDLNPYKIYSKWNVLIEENLLYFLNKRMYGCNPTTILDCTGFHIPKNTYNPYEYYHIWGSKKNPKIIREYKEIAINYIPESVSDKIEMFFNGRSRSTNTDNNE